MPEPRSPIGPASAAQAERLHGFAHDLKNRLGGLWGSLKLLGDMPPGLERAELEAYIERNFFGAQSDIESLLDDMSVDRAVRMDRTGPVDLDQVMREAIDKESFRTGKKEQRCVLNSRGACIVQGDEHWLSQLMQALVSNASKFSARGSVITCDLCTESGHAVLRVIDTGVGMTTQDIERVFTRYAMLSSRSTDGEAQMRGTLSRAFQWAIAHGGSLEAESQGQGTGCTFSLRIPLRKG